MENPDLSKMSVEERHLYLSSLPLDELLKHEGVHKTNGHPDGPAWMSLGDRQCHICHRPITDEASLKVKIGSSDCRPRIEHEMKRGPEMWGQLSIDELEIIWTRFNVHGVYIDDVAHKVKQVHRKGDLVVFDLHDTEEVLVKGGSEMSLLSRETARTMWRAH